MKIDLTEENSNQVINITKGATQTNLDNAIAVAREARDTAITQASNASGSASSAASSASSSASSASTATTKASEASTSATSASGSASSASTSAATATTQAGIATDKAGEASTSEVNAGNSATAASNSATSASSSADTATTKASEASTSATSASGSATTATTQASTATTKANEASVSADNASTSETNASTSETNAAASSASATASANSAGQSAIDAQSSEDDAEASQIAAANSASAAANSASSASTSATTATTQASIATTQATNASNSATSAATSLDSFEGQYVSQATEPTTPTEGMLWFDTTNNLMKVYDGSIFQLAGSSVNGTVERQTYVATSGQTIFNATYDAGYVDVYLNGIKLVPTTDFTATDGTTVVLTSGATAGDDVEIVAYGTFELADHYTKTEVDNSLDLKANIADVPNGANSAITDNGTNVGIGTSSPTHQLDVQSQATFRGGITFNGDTSSANALDDYEEGTWTPSFNGYSTGFSGTYTKIGNVVHCRISRWGAIPLGSIADNVIVSGLPFSSSGRHTFQFAHARGLTSDVWSILDSGGVTLGLFYDIDTGTAYFLASHATYDVGFQNGTTSIILDWVFTYRVG